INQLMGWRNYATTRQTGASFIPNSPSFALASADNYANYFLGQRPPFTAPFTTVSAVSWAPPGLPPRTDQAVMTRRGIKKPPTTPQNPPRQFPPSHLPHPRTDFPAPQQPTPQLPPP